MENASLIFYETAFPEKMLPRLVEKIYHEGTRAWISTLPERLSFWDMALWTYTPISFLPHGCEGLDEPAQDHPIWISSNPIPNPPGFWDVHVSVEIAPTLWGQNDNTQRTCVFILPAQRETVLAHLSGRPGCHYWYHQGPHWNAIPLRNP